MNHWNIIIIFQNFNLLVNSLYYLPLIIHPPTMYIHSLSWIHGGLFLFLSCGSSDQFWIYFIWWWPSWLNTHYEFLSWTLHTIHGDIKKRKLWTLGVTSISSSRKCLTTISNNFAFFWSASNKVQSLTNLNLLIWLNKKKVKW